MRNFCWIKQSKCIFDSDRRFELRRIRDIRVRDIEIRLYMYMYNTKMYYYKKGSAKGTVCGKESCRSSAMFEWPWHDPYPVALTGFWRT